MTEGRRSQDERLALSRMPPTVVIAFKVEPAIQDDDTKGLLGAQHLPFPFRRRGREGSRAVCSPMSRQSERPVLSRVQRSVDESPFSTGSRTLGSSFSGLFTRIEMGHLHLLAWVRHQQVARVRFDVRQPSVICLGW